MIFLNVNKAHQLAKYWTSSARKKLAFKRMTGAHSLFSFCLLKDSELISIRHADKSFLDRSFFPDNESKIQLFVLRCDQKCEILSAGASISLRWDLCAVWLRAIFRRKNVDLSFKQQNKQQRASIDLRRN